MDALFALLVSGLVGVVCYRAGVNGREKIWRLYRRSLQYNRHLFDSWFDLVRENDALREDLEELQQRIRSMPVAEIREEDDWWKHGGEPPEWLSN